MSITIKYNEVQNTLKLISKRFSKKYGGDWHEWMSHANEQFMYAFKTYDVERGDFYKWVRFIVDKRLLGIVRKRCKENKMFTEIDTNKLESKNKDQLENLLTDLSDDAIKVIGVTLSIDESIIAKNSTIHYEKVRKTLLRLLRELGWAAERITETFKEIGQSI